MITTVGDAVLEDVPADLRGQVLPVLRWNFDALKRHGVKVAIGSDEYRSTAVPEALTIARAGLMTNAEVLRSLSVTTPAAIYPRRAPFGLAEGAPASFIAVERDPLEDLRAITTITLRVKEGRDLNLAR